MKKYLFTLVALMAMLLGAQNLKAQTVYISTGDGATAYHKSKDCSYLQKSKQVKSVSTSEASSLGRHACARCYGQAAAKKTVAKKTDVKKTDVKKTEAKKKTAPARDEKGRFIKTTDTKKTTTKKAAEKKTTTKKKATEKKKEGPARDEKGRFIKKAA